jgi:hypothetical protein
VTRSRTSQPRDLSVFIAQTLSLAGHPFFTIPLTVAVLARSWRYAAVIAVTTTLPIALIIARNVRRGTWSDADVSRRDQRSSLYYAMVPVLLVSGIALHLTGASPRMMAGVLAAAIMLIAGLLANRFLKVSMHLMFDAYCAINLAAVFPRLIPLFVLALAAVAWSRRKLDRHTWAELAVGTVIGLVVGAWAAS